MNPSQRADKSANTYAKLSHILFDLTGANDPTIDEIRDELSAVMRRIEAINTEALAFEAKETQ